MYIAICCKCGINKSTLGDIKKNQERILTFKSEMIGMSRKAKVMKLGDDQQLDKAVYLWFNQKGMDGVLISGPGLC